MTSESNKPASAYLVYGDDEYMVSTNARALVDQLCPPENQDFGLEIVEGGVLTVAEAVQAVKKCVDALQTLGFLSGNKTVWLKDAAFLGRAATAESDDLKAAIDTLVKMLKAGLPQGQVLVLSAPKVDAASALFKAFRAVGEVRQFGVPEKTHQAEQQARDRVRQAFQQVGLSGGRDVVEEFLGRTGVDTRQIVQEAEKLSLYVGGRRNVSVDDVRAIVSPSREAITWDFADAVGNRNLPLALKVLRQLLFQGENAIGLVIGLESRFRDLLMYRECLDRKFMRVSGDEPWLKIAWRDDPEVDEAMARFVKDPRKANAFRAGRLVAQARKFSMDELERGQALVVETHESLVCSSTPKHMLLEFLLIKLLGPRAPSRNQPRQMEGSAR